MKLDYNTLIEQCKAKKRGSDECLFKALYPKLMPVCMSYVKNDDAAIEVYNQTFLKIYHKLSLHNTEKSFLGWCRRIAVNTSLDYLRANEKWRNKQEIEGAMVMVSTDGSAIEQMAADEILQLFRRLSPRLRSVAQLYIVEGWSHNEIAKKLNISTGTSKWSLNQARSKLQEWVLVNQKVKKSI